MRTLFILLFVTACSESQVNVCVDLPVESPPQLRAVAAAALRPAGAPRYSDVSLRYGWVREGEYPTVADAAQAVSAFHATRVDWFYSGLELSNVTAADRNFINMLHSRGLVIGGAIHTNTDHEPWGLRESSLGRYVGDPFNPDYTRTVLNWGKEQIDAGVSTLLVDDFFNYEEAEQAQFEQEVVRPLRAYRDGFRIAANHGHFIGTDYVSRWAFDFHYSDTSFEPTPGQWWDASRQHRAYGSALVSHPNQPWDVGQYRRQIALGYAAGAHVVMPWDRFLSGSEVRAFGLPEDYADISGFVRALGQHGYLDSYEDAAVGGYRIRETRYDIDPLTVSGGNPNVSLFARAVPNARGADVVVHLVRWDGDGTTTVRLRTAAFFDGDALTVKLWTRRPYDRVAHDVADQIGDYASLVWDRTADLTVRSVGIWTEVTVPTLYPWGVLIVERSPCCYCD